MTDGAIGPLLYNGNGGNELDDMGYGDDTDIGYGVDVGIEPPNDGMPDNVPWPNCAPVAR